MKSIRTGAEPEAEELTEHLQAENAGLRWEIGTPENGARELVISAGGIRDVIAAVEALVAAAPPIPGWKVTAFKQRKEVKTIQMEGHAFDVESIWFKAVSHREHVDLDLYLEAVETQDELPYHVAFLFLDVVLGEYDVMTKVGNIDFHSLPPNPAAKGLKPITDLAAIVDAL